MIAESMVLEKAMIRESFRRVRVVRYHSIWELYDTWSGGGREGGGREGRRRGEEERRRGGEEGGKEGGGLDGACPTSDGSLHPCTSTHTHFNTTQVSLARASAAHSQPPYVLHASMLCTMKFTHTAL